MTASKTWKIIWWCIGIYFAAVLLYRLISGNSTLFFWLLGFGASGIVGSGIYYWSTSRVKKELAKSEKLGPACTFTQAEAFLDVDLLDPRNLIRIDRTQAITTEVREVGKPSSKVFVREFIAKVPRGKKVLQAINMHLPETLKGIIIDTEIDAARKNHFIKSKAAYPEQEAPVKRTTSEDLITGRRVTTDEPVVGKESKPEKEDPLTS